MRILIVVITFFSILSQAASKTELYEKVFGKIDRYEEITVLDPISDNPINTKIKIAYRNNKRLGFIREITTTTGCNSACLPVVYTSFYDQSGAFKTIKSRDGLTKIYHAPFTKEDYSNLEFLILSKNPLFESVKHPKEMTDAITGATIKKFQTHVVKGAAYSTLRIYLYNHQTQAELKKYLKK